MDHKRYREAERALYFRMILERCVEGVLMPDTVPSGSGLLGRGLGQRVADLFEEQRVTPLVWLCLTVFVIYSFLQNKEFQASAFWLTYT